MGFHFHTRSPLDGVYALHTSSYGFPAAMADAVDKQAIFMPPPPARRGIGRQAPHLTAQEESPTSEAHGVVRGVSSWGRVAQDRTECFLILRGQPRCSERWACVVQTGVDRIRARYLTARLPNPPVRPVRAAF